jgi:DNA-binding CsgD family transcriptional regulator
VAVPWAPDLVEAYVRVGRVADARRLVSEMETRRAGEQCALAAALMARCSGLVGNGDADSFYREALVAHSEVLAPFERGRTLLSYGEWLRRERRLPDAIPHLEEAASTFNDLGARPWYDRAISELVAHGRRSTNAPRRGMSALTPQEVRVARAVAGGATNREAAAALFLSPRTVEYHLGNVYRKLGVRSRSELTRQMGRGPELVSGTESVSDDA